MKNTMKFLILLFIFSVLATVIIASTPLDVKLDEKAKLLHRIDSLNILIYVFLLIMTVCTIWLLKRRRSRLLHETGLAIFYGLAVGAIIHYSGQDSEISHLSVIPSPGTNKTFETPPDSLFFTFVHHDEEAVNKSYAYVFKGELIDLESKKLNQKATFDPEIFFNIILPPIIFNAGYSLKRKYFFRNLGTIMTFAFIGTTISCFVTGAVLYVFLLLMPYLKFTFNDCLYFGAIISATDPVTILAIFSDLHVDVNLYALVFGESILNDAVAIVLAGAISSYGDTAASSSTGFETNPALKSICNFLYIFVSSFFIGSTMGCFTAILAKFTRLCDFPVLESCLFVLMSYSTFLMAEALDLTGIVAVLFCGICQAHYTYNNLSQESRVRTKQFFDLLNFLSESFIFSYIGVSMFTYPKHHWDAGFIFASIVSIFIGRAFNIYPLSFILNLGRNNKIPPSFQHVLFFSGLRGAMAFALAIRNTMSDQRHLILTATSLISIITVIVCGGFTTQLLTLLGIPVGITDDHELLPFGSVRMSNQVTTPTELRSPPATQESKTPYEKAWLVRKWFNFDVKYMKPLLTHSRPTLMDTLPKCCLPLARIFTSEQQLSREYKFNEDSDNEAFIDESDLNFGGTRGNSVIEEDLGLGINFPSGSMKIYIPGQKGDHV